MLLYPANVEDLTRKKIPDFYHKNEKFQSTRSLMDLTTFAKNVLKSRDLAIISVKL